MTRKQASFATDVPEDKIYVHAQDVGGSFGQRSAVYPEYCMQMLAAKELGKPVRWISSRSEGFMTDTHGRGNIVNGELALDKDGNFLAVRLDWIADMGAYLSATGSASHTRNATTCLTGVYRIPALYNHMRLAFTNTAPIAAFRGAGRPDIAYVIERLVNAGRGGSQDGSGGAAAAEPHTEQRSFRTRRRTARPTRTRTSRGASTRRSRPPTGRASRSGAPQAKKRGQLRGIGIATVIEPTGAGMFPKDQVADRVHRRTRSPRLPCRIPRARATRPRSRWWSPMRSSVPMDKVLIRQERPGEEPDRQPHRRLALDGGAGQRVQARGAEARRAVEIRSRARAGRRALAGRVRARRVPARRNRRRR